jgi:hypothetical protein
MPNPSPSLIFFANPNHTHGELRWGLAPSLQRGRAHERSGRACARRGAVQSRVRRGRDEQTCVRGRRMQLEKSRKLLASFHGLWFLYEEGRQSVHQPLRWIATEVVEARSARPDSRCDPITFLSTLTNVVGIRPHACVYNVKANCDDEVLGKISVR